MSVLVNAVCKIIYQRLILSIYSFQVTEELESVKAEMDEKGTSMTDAGPLVRVKQALTRLKTECTQMDIRIGVVSRTFPGPVFSASHQATLKSWERGSEDEGG